MFFALVPALADAPLDADGAYVHVATLPLNSLASPGPVQRTIQTGAWARGPDRSLWLAYGVGELARFTPDGHLERDAWLHIRTRTMGIMGRFAVRDDAVYYYEMPHGPKRADLRTGEITSALAPVEPPAPWSLFTHGDTFWLWNPQNTVTRFTGSAWSAPERVEPLRTEPFFEGGQKTKPCGEREDGTPITTARHWERKKSAAFALGPDLTAGTEIWSYVGDLEEWGRRSFDAWMFCDFAGGRLLAGSTNQLFVYDGTGLISAIRNGAGKEDGHPDFGATANVYSFQNLLTAQLLAKGEVLVTVEIQTGELKVFGTRVDAPAKALAKARKENDPLLLLRAGATGPERLEAMWELGWWEAVERDARTAGANDWVARARARQIVHWASSGPPGLAYMGPNRNEQLDGTYLQEIETLLNANPGEPWLLYAQALLLQRLDRATDARTALSALQSALPGKGITVADVPELFELAASRGDLDAMRKMHDAIDATRDARTHALWAARIARTAGQPADAVAILKALAEDREVLTLRARSQADAGELDAAIATWTKAKKVAPDDPAIAGGLGVAYLRRGLTELAVESLLQAADGDPGTPAHRSNLAAAYAALDRKNDAMKQLYGALADSPDDPLLQHQLAAANGAGAGGAGGDIAVLPFDVAGGSVERVGLGDMLASLVTTTLVGAGAGVVERAKLDAVLAEQDLQRTARVDPKTAVQLGRIAGAKWVVTGNVSEFQGKVVFDVRRVDVQSGKVVAAKSGNAPFELEPLQAALDAAVAGVRP